MASGLDVFTLSSVWAVDMEVLVSHLEVAACSLRGIWRRCGPSRMRWEVESGSEVANPERTARMQI